MCLAPQVRQGGVSVFLGSGGVQYERSKAFQKPQPSENSADGYNVNNVVKMEENYGEAAAFLVRCHQKHLGSRDGTHSIDL